MLFRPIGEGHGVGAVAMHLTAQFDNIAALKLLLQRKADPTIKDGAFGATPLGWAQHNNADAAAKVLEEFLAK